MKKIADVRLTGMPPDSNHAGRDERGLVASRLLPSRDEIRALFGLTPAQAALAREILHGDGIDAAARRLGISRSTARTHLLDVFQKTGTSRQAELVRLVLTARLPEGYGAAADHQPAPSENKAGC